MFGRKKRKEARSRSGIMSGGSQDRAGSLPEPQGWGAMSEAQGSMPGSVLSPVPAGLGREGLGSALLGEVNPLLLMRRWLEEMDRVFGRDILEDLAIDEALAPFAQSTAIASMIEWAPQIEVFERDGKVVVRADIPGVKPEDVRVRIDEGVLTISGERRSEQREREQISERTYGCFERAVRLPDGCDLADIDATFHDGVLEIRAQLTTTSHEIPIKRVETGAPAVGAPAVGAPAVGKPAVGTRAQPDAATADGGSQRRDEQAEQQQQRST